MPAPRPIVDGLESVFGIYFSGIRHRERASFILTDELVEMACKMRAREHNQNFNFRCDFPTAVSAPGVALPSPGLGAAVQANHSTRNNLQHVNVAITVDDQHCADAILDAVQVIDHCWPGSSATALRGWMAVALRVIRLYSSQGDQRLRSTFEDSIRAGAWRAIARPPRQNELVIEPGRRQYWSLLMIQSQVQVEGILNSLGIP